MIALLDQLLFRLFRSRIVGLSADPQVRFQPPDDDWRAAVPTIADASGHPAVSLNVYLFDLRENRKLRHNERERTDIGFDSYITQPPRRVDCHYLISAWSPVTPSPMVEPAFDEHALLADAARVLGESDPLDPVTLCAATRPGLPAVPVPAELVGETLPVTLLPVEGFLKLGEFWGTMGQHNRWKPCLYAVVTVALKDVPVRSGGIVTTALMHTRTTGHPESEETFMHIGGSLRASAAINAPVVPGAWVELLTGANVRRQVVVSDALGRFVFVQVSPGSYRLRYAAQGFTAQLSAPFTVPSPSGSYDQHF